MSKRAALIVVITLALLLPGLAWQSGGAAPPNLSLIHI